MDILNVLGIIGAIFGLLGIGGILGVLKIYKTKIIKETRLDDKVSSLHTRVDCNDKSLDDLKEVFNMANNLKEKVISNEARIKAIEANEKETAVKLGRIEEKLDFIVDGITEIKKK